MGRAVRLAACAINQWALDFEGNAGRILKSEPWGVPGGSPLPGLGSWGGRAGLGLGSRLLLEHAPFFSRY